MADDREEIDVHEEMRDIEDDESEGSDAESDSGESDASYYEEGLWGWIEEKKDALLDSPVFRLLGDAYQRAASLTGTIIVKGGNWVWILGTSLLITAFPLLLEVEREQQSRDIEAAQVDYLRKQGYSRDQISQLGLGASAPAA